MMYCKLKSHFNKYSQFITTLGQTCLKYNPEPCNEILVHCTQVALQVDMYLWFL